MRQDVSGCQGGARSLLFWLRGYSIIDFTRTQRKVFVVKDEDKTINALRYSEILRLRGREIYKINPTI